MSGLKPLSQHEAERAANKFDSTPGYATGIACPECGAELFAFIGGVDMLDHYKGRRPVFCRKCKHETTIAPGGGPSLMEVMRGRPPKPVPPPNVTLAKGTRAQLYLGIALVVACGAAAIAVIFFRLGAH
jgi:hypothetical protein